MNIYAKIFVAETLVATLLTGHATTVDHREFEAALVAPFHADRSGQRTVTMHFDFPGEQQTHPLRWRLDLLAQHGDTVLRQWRGEGMLGGAALDQTVTWRSGPGTPNGLYRLRLRASVDDGPETEQSWPVAVGLAAPAPASSSRLAAMAAPAASAQQPRSFAAAPARPAAAAPASSLAAAAPYDIYLGNLHSQTNHSDGGGTLSHCTGAQAPQSAALGPTDAWKYAQQRGLNFLMTSEHNHMFDGSDGTNADADPEAVKALYQSGLSEANHWNQANPGFLAIYGQEWGVINHGGHLNILNSGELLGWERNAGGKLLADDDTPKGGYGTLYALMRERGWAGQFNHPQRDQFAIDGKALAWNADGDEVMLLCEVMNTNAFSTSTDESETRRSNFEASCNALLEAGYHVAFSTNQDNHCANWGASYGNRTGVLLPKGKPLTPENFLEALRARRVYATMDKHAQLVLSANGRVMGERFSNQGKLTLQAGYASKTGRRAASLTIFEGVPGRNGTVTALSTRALTSLTPAPGEHFYYARVTQDDGNMLWSAPIWVTQLSPGATPIVR
jgi:hypothetical protein